MEYDISFLFFTPDLAPEMQLITPIKTQHKCIIFAKFRWSTDSFAYSFALMMSSHFVGGVISYTHAKNIVG